MELLLFWNKHWFDLCTPERQAVLNTRGKYDGHLEVGDILEYRQSGFFINNDVLQTCRRDKFVVIDIEDMTINQAKAIVNKCWDRGTNFSIDSVNDSTGIYDYTISIADSSILSLFDNDKDKFLKLPDRVTLIGRNTTEIRLRLTLPVEWSQTDKTVKRLFFQSEGKNTIKELQKNIKKSQYKIDLINIPTAYQTKLTNDGWARGTYSQLQSYIIDKAV